MRMSDRTPRISPHRVLTDSYPCLYAQIYQGFWRRFALGCAAKSIGNVFRYRISLDFQ